MNMSNFYVFNRSQKRRFMLFYYVLRCFICILLPLLCETIYSSFLVWNSSDPKRQLFILCIYYEE